MPPDHRLQNPRFPRSANYNPDWQMAGLSGGANPLWLTEWLTSAMDLRPGMRVLDLGCGRACSSIFLHREFNLQAWAVDLWFSPTENQKRIEDAGAAHAVFPLQADARSLPFATEFFDAIIAIDSYFYFGTDDLYLNNLARFLKPGAPIAIAGAGLTQEWPEEIPAHLASWWTSDLACLHSAQWWRRHWQRSGTVTVELSDTMPDGWQLWLDWHTTVAPDNHLEIDALKADRGQYLTYTRTIARRNPAAKLDNPTPSIPAQYTPKPLLRTSD